MRKKFAVFYFLIGLILSSWMITGCENEKDAYYKRPGWLEPPIIEVLKERNDMSLYIEMLKKSGYERTLSGGGYYTVFAPTDSAVKAYLGQQTIESIDSVLLRKIVAYSIISSAYSKEQLDDYQSAKDQYSDIDAAFKRQTKMYKWVYNDSVKLDDGSYSMGNVIDANAVLGGESNSNGYTSDDYNYKSIPYFTTNFLANKKLTPADYEYLFEGSSFSGFNVADANLIKGDIYAENGIIHIVDKVIMPLPNLDEYLNEKDSFSIFNELINKFIINYSHAPASFQLLFEQTSGKRESVYGKFYPGLAFAPNCENFLRYGEGGETYDHQKNGWTMFAPDNSAMRKFFNDKFLKHYPSIDYMSTDQIADFINAHFWLNTVWPCKFSNYQNIYGEEARFDITTDVVEHKMCSNGIFYGVNKVQATDLYYTVLGDINLNPEYSEMLQAIRSYPTILSILKNPEVSLQVFLISNKQMADLGFEFNLDFNRWEFNKNYNNALGNNASTALERILYLHMIQGENIDLNGSGIVRTGIDDRGEYIRYYRNIIWAAGNPSNALPRLASQTDSAASNGQSYTLTTPLKFSIENIGTILKSNSQFREFYRYLEKSAISLSSVGESMQGFLYNTETLEITDVLSTSNNTLFIPTNAAIQQAVADSILPPIAITDFSLAEQEKVKAFINYHIMPKRIFVPVDGFTDAAVTLYKVPDGDTYVTISSTASSMQITDSQGITANVNITRSNILANRAVIHQIDNYLRYPQN